MTQAGGGSTLEIVRDEGGVGPELRHAADLYVAHASGG